MRSGIRERIVLVLGPPLAALVNACLYRLNRIELIDEKILKSFWSNGTKVILCFWHDQMFLMNRGYRGSGAQVLVSASTDGELIARVMARFGIESVRGSSTRGGGKAFRQMLGRPLDSFDLVITPDGPKGPRHQVKHGAVRLARLTGRPVVPMSLACSRGVRFSSWDRFLLPFPFGRLVIRFGPPLFFDQESDPEKCRSLLQEAMLANDREARIALEVHGVSAV